MECETGCSTSGLWVAIQIPDHLNLTHTYSSCLFVPVDLITGLAGK